MGRSGQALCGSDRVRKIYPGKPRTREGVGSRVGSGQPLHGSGRVRKLALEVGSGSDPGGSGRVRIIGPGKNSERWCNGVTYRKAKDFSCAISNQE